MQNPCCQSFTAETYFQHHPPFDPTDYVYLRKRAGEAGMQKILSLTVCPHCGSEVKKEVLVNTRVQEKDVTYAPGYLIMPAIRAGGGRRSSP